VEEGRGGAESGGLRGDAAVGFGQAATLGVETAWLGLGWIEAGALTTLMPDAALVALAMDPELAVEGFDNGTGRAAAGSCG